MRKTIVLLLALAALLLFFFLFRVCVYPRQLTLATREFSFTQRPLLLNHLVHQRELAGPGFRSIVSPNDSTLYSDAWLTEDMVDVSFTPLHKRYVLLSVLDQEGNVIWSQSSYGSPIVKKIQGYWFISRVFCAGAGDLKGAWQTQDQIQLRGKFCRYEGPINLELPPQRIRNPLQMLGIPFSMIFPSRNDWLRLDHVGESTAGCVTRAFLAQLIFAGNQSRDTLYFFRPVQAKLWYRLSLCTQPQDVNSGGFWSLSFYNENGFFVPHETKARHSYPHCPTRVQFQVPDEVHHVIFRVYVPLKSEWWPENLELLSLP